VRPAPPDLPPQRQLTWDFPGVLSTDVLTSGHDGCRRDTATPISFHRC
jgi:hypothetical protein